MAYEQRDNTFSLFKNNYKEKNNHPDLKGTMMVNGHTYEISAWKKEGKNGPFYSGQVNEPYNKGGGKSKKQDDEVPFDI